MAIALLFVRCNAMKGSSMIHFEIDLPIKDAAAFDEGFWRFVQGRLINEVDPDVRMDAYRVGDLERRIVMFEHRDHAAAFTAACGDFGGRSLEFVPAT